MQTEDTHRRIFPVWEGLRVAGFQQIWRSGEGESWQMAAEWDRDGKLECEGMRPDYESAREYINRTIPLIPVLEEKARKDYELREQDFDLVATLTDMQEKALCNYLLTESSSEINLNWQYEYDREKVLRAWERICKIVAKTKNIWVTEGGKDFLVFFALGKNRKVERPEGATLPGWINVYKTKRSSIADGTGRRLFIEAEDGTPLNFWWYTLGTQSKESYLPKEVWQDIVTRFRKCLPNWWEILASGSEIQFIADGKLMWNFYKHSQTWEEFLNK